MGTEKEEHSFEGLFSILNLLPYSDDYSSCNTLLKIANRCN